METRTLKVKRREPETLHSVLRMRAVKKAKMRLTISLNRTKKKYPTMKRKNRLVRKRRTQRRQNNRPLYPVLPQGLLQQNRQPPRRGPFSASLFHPRAQQSLRRIARLPSLFLLVLAVQHPQVLLLKQNASLRQLRRMPKFHLPP